MPSEVGAILAILMIFALLFTADQEFAGGGNCLATEAASQTWWPMFEGGLRSIAGWARRTLVAHSASPHVPTDFCAQVDPCETAVFLDERAIIGRVLLVGTEADCIESSNHCTE
jgi:hypothetical protein